MAEAEKSVESFHGLTNRDMQLVAITLKYCVGGAEGLKVSSHGLPTIFSISASLTHLLHLFSDSMQVDYKLLAQHGGFKTPNSANASWCGLKKKLFANDATKTKAGAKIPDPKTGSPGNGDVGSGANDDTPGATPASPTVAKKPKTPRKRKTADTAEGGDAAEPAAKKPRARKPKGETGPKKGKGEVKKSSSPETHHMDPANMKEEDGDETDDTVVKGEPIEDTVEAV